MTNPDNTTPTPVKWHHKPVTVIMAFLCVGALALPLLWTSPAFSKKLKVVITLLVIALSIWLVKLSMDLYTISMNRLQELQELMGY